MECLAAFSKNWISNYKASKRLSGEPRQNATKAVLVRKRSGYNVFAKEQLSEGDSKLKKQKFSELGSRWKDLTYSRKEEYREKARNLKDLEGAQGFSDDQRSKRIVKNIMKEVAELDSINGVECLVVCVEGGSIYHASTKLDQKFLEKYPGTVINFGNIIQNAFLNDKKDVSDQIIRTISNKKYSTLVDKSSPLPYSKVQSLGLKFDGLPSELMNELGCYPKQPNHYGAQQKPKVVGEKNLHPQGHSSLAPIIQSATPLPSHSLSKNDDLELTVSQIIEQTIFLTASNGLSLQLKEGTAFGLMDERNMVTGTGKVMAKVQLHGRPIAPGCLVVEVVSVKEDCVIKPPVPGTFDDENAVEVGGFYLWPISKLSFLNKTGIQVGINK